MDIWQILCADCGYNENGEVEYISKIFITLFPHKLRQNSKDQVQKRVFRILTYTNDLERSLALEWQANASTRDAKLIQSNSELRHFYDFDFERV